MTQNHCERSCMIQSFFWEKPFLIPSRERSHIPQKGSFDSMVFLFPYGGICYLFLEGKSLSKSNHGMNHRTSWLGVAEWFLGRFCCETLDLWRTSPPKLSLESRNSQAFTCHHFFFSVASIHFLQMEEALDIWPKFRKFHNREQCFQRLWKKSPQGGPLLHSCK